MDASASNRADVERNSFGFFLKIENTEFPKPEKRKNTAIKFTKLPDLDFESKEPWPRQSYTLQPRLRRIITLEDPKSICSRSLKSDYLTQPIPMETNISKRKIITISEDDEYDLHPRFSKDANKTSSVKTTNRSIEADFKEPKQTTKRITSRLSNSSKYSKEAKPSAKLSNVYDVKEPKPKSNYRSKPSNISHVPVENTRSRNVRVKDPVKSKNINASKTLSKNYITPSESEKELSLIKSKLYTNLKSSTSTKRLRVSKSPPPPPKSKVMNLKEFQSKQKPIQVIHVPLEEKYRKYTSVTPPAKITTYLSETELVNSDNAATTHNDKNISTDPLPEKVDSVTEMEQIDPQMIYKCADVKTTEQQTELFKETYGSLEIPNVTLTTSATKEKSHSQSLPNLQVPPFKVMLEGDTADTSYHKSTSYIISRATLTYTTKQQFNLHVVGSSDDAYSNKSPSPLSYPINVVSVFKKEMQDLNSSNDNTAEKERDKTSKQIKNRINDVKLRDCTYLADKLMKPSDVISRIRINNELLRSEYICEQFQRELHFIDSFFESLQYLESCSLSEKCFKDDNTEAIVNPVSFEAEFDAKSLEYDRFFSKLENSGSADDSETMASKNLYMLNILIRDEQRRAKNLLFVLKKREDALKDFTKSQILYLENKKRQDNTDISALKKKQRGALIKLQHECGEMQRMRKALLTLSEKRKVTLMKTKKDLELKLNNNVDKMVLAKKKLKRNTSLDRTSPLKCFDLSSSGCEESSTSRRNSVETLSSPEHVRVRPVPSAEKSIQAGDGALGTAMVNQTTDTAAENFIIVDGGYLNILFHSLSLPHIFSGGKQYEVNENALRNIVSSSSSRQHIDENNVIETLIEKIKRRDFDKSNTPSTARSLVEELDQYYKGLNDCDKSDRTNPIEADYKSSSTVCELTDANVQVEPLLIENRSYQNMSTMTIDSNETIVNNEVEIKSSEPCVCSSEEGHSCEEIPVVSPTGPLPVPAGADVVDTPPPDIPLWLPVSSSNTTFSDSSVSSQSLNELVSSVTSLTAPAQCEAEELRRQQLAIEKEIKELEQQQCRLLAVREIPDKPPPPYTPPAPSEHLSKLPRRFHTNDDTEDRIRTYMTEENVQPCDPSDCFDVFVNDFCHESLARRNQGRSDKPWDACNLLPPKPEQDPQKLVNATTIELSEVLAGAKPTVVSGVFSKRSDQIDDILFAEWRQVEPEWTSLQSDEAAVKNQIFESIFQRILTDTVDEYKRTVLCEPVNN